MLQVTPESFSVKLIKNHQLVQRIPLDEIDCSVLFRKNDHVFLFDKDTNIDSWNVCFYGYATIAHLGLINDWAIIAGDRLLLLKNNTLKWIIDPDFKTIYSIQQIDDDVVELLTDSENRNALIWHYNVMTEEKIEIPHYLYPVFKFVE